MALKFQQLLQKHGFESAIINVQVDDPAKQVHKIKALDRTARKLLNAARYWMFRLYVRTRYKKSKLHNFTYNSNSWNLTPEEIINTVPFKPDIIFLHWIADFLTPELLEELYRQYQCPIIWRYNDLAPVTGGCHYLAGCDHYQTGCGKCPALGSSNSNDWSHQFWLRKSEIFPRLPITIINSTHHTETVFKASSLFKGKSQHFIRNSLSQDVYNFSDDKPAQRGELGLPINKKILFWGATHIAEPRKGFKYLVEAISQLDPGDRDQIHLVIAGNKPADLNPDIAVSHQFIGLVDEKSLVKYYKSSDLVVCTSLEDGGPMMIVEALMCGTPLVSFATGLALELVITEKTGYRAEKADSKDLAIGITYVLNLPAAEYQMLQARCHQQALALYGESQEITAYQKLFEELLK